MLGLGVGVAGMLLSYYFYTISIKVREPSFVITKDVSLFSSQKGLSSKYIKLIKSNDGKELFKNIYIKEVAIWNNGKESIKEANVLKPVKLIFNEGVEIIDAFVSEINRPDIVKGKAYFKPGGNAVTISFSILENDDGMKVQVVYASLESSSAEVGGVIEGVDKIKNIDELVKDNILFSVAKVLMWGGGAIVFMLLVSSMGEISEWVVNRVFGSHANKVNLIIKRTVAVAIILGFAAVVAITIYTKTIEYSKKSVFESIPVMEKNNNMVTEKS